MSNNFGRIELSPGIYVLDGNGLDITGGDFIAEGVMIYVMDSTPSGQPQSHIYIGGNGTIVITAPDPAVDSFPGADTYEGISLFQARDNTNLSTIIGTTGMRLDGTLYFPANKLNLGGNGGQIGNQLIAHTADVFGNGTLFVGYAGENPLAGGAVYLVR
jgi:hypothetical protein